MSEAAAPRRILVVDDEPDMKALFEQRFRREIRAGRVQFQFAFSGEEALRTLFEGEAPEKILILSDINMPGMTGLELLRRIKARNPAPVVMMVTAYGDEDTRAKALNFGADDFLAKPIDFDLLRERLALRQEANP